MRLAAASSGHAALQRFDLGLELLDHSVALLQVLVEAVTLGDELLLPLPEALFLDLDLFRESLPKLLFFLLELGVIQLPWSCLAELSGLHLLSAVCLVVVLLSSVDQIKHVCADKNGAQLLKVAVLLILNLCDTPGVLTSLDGATVWSADVPLGSYHGEWHGSNQATSVLQASLIVFLERWGVDLDALSLNDISDLCKLIRLCSRQDSITATYAVLELGKVSWGERVSLGDDWDQVDAGAEALHDLNVKRLQSVASWADEVETGVDSQINLLCSPWLLLLEHVALMLVIQELNDWLPAVSVVHVVSKARGINDGQADLEELLFQLGLGDLDLDGLVDLLRVTSAVVGVVLDGGGEEGVDEGGFAQARLACDHDGEGSAALGNDLVTLVGELAGASVMPRKLALR